MNDIMILWNWYLDNYAFSDVALTNILQEQNAKIKQYFLTNNNEKLEV